MEGVQEVRIPPQCPAGKKFVSSPLQHKVITCSHTSLATGHPSIHKTHQLLQDKYRWLQMRQDRFISTCSVFAKAKVRCTLPVGKLLLLPTPHRPWSHLTTDFIANLPSSQNKTVIMVIMDWFSMSLCLIPLRH